MMIHPCDKPCGNKTASGYCATTACINPQYSNMGTAQYGQGVQKRIITHGDEFRVMTDEELAAAICKIEQTQAKQGHCGFHAWLDYLKQEVK